jgi:LDH2 family malate/lactate/ureidoglycolate dehydrogenase
MAGSLRTNPIAVGVPTGDETPFVLDFATSIVAEGKIQVARSKNLSVPPGYLIDKHGQPTITPTDLYEGGFLLPFGAHKGSGLSILFTLLGGLSGTFDVNNNGYMKGEFMQVFNIEAFLPLEEYQRGVRAFLNNIKASPPAAGVAEVLVPGDFEYKNRVERLVKGIEIPGTIYGQLNDWANKLDVSLGEDMVEAGDRARYVTRL